MWVTKVEINNSITYSDWSAEFLHPFMHLLNEWEGIQKKIPLKTYIPIFNDLLGKYSAEPKRFTSRLSKMQYWSMKFNDL